MLTAFFDETNTSPNQQVPMVAGYLASSLQWSRFNEQWDKLLRHADVPIDPRYGIRLVHRNELQHRVGKFKSWSSDQRDEFLAKAYAIIRRHTKVPIGNAVVRKHFVTLTSKSLQRTIGGPYGWCVHACLHAVKAYCDKYGHNEPVRYVLEIGAPGYGQVQKYFNALSKHAQSKEYYRLGDVSFETKTVRALQAADFLAYDLGRYALDYELGRTRLEINQYLSCALGPTQPRDSQVRFWTEDVLRKHAKALTEECLFKD